MSSINYKDGVEQPNQPDAPPEPEGVLHGLDASQVFKKVSTDGPVSTGAAFSTSSPEPIEKTAADALGLDGAQQNQDHKKDPA